MRVLLVCAVNGHGGPIQSLASVVTRATSVHTVLATQLARPGRRRSAIESVTDDQIDLPRPRGYRLIAAQWTLLRRVRWLRRNVDVIHANGLTEAAVVAPVALLSGLPVVVWVHNFQRPRSFSILEPLIRRRGRWRWLAVSELAADQVHGSHVDLLYNPISQDVVAPQRRTHDGFLVAYLAGTDRPYKGFDLLPDIIEATDRTDVHWRIYTSPPFSSPDPACRAGWRRLQALDGGIVEILPRTSDVASAYASADVVIAPSRLESFNRVVAEAFANGVPVVASDIGPHRALVEQSGGGLLFALDAPGEAAAAVKALADDPQRRDEYGRAARNYASVSKPIASVRCSWPSGSLRRDQTSTADRSVCSHASATTSISKLSRQCVSAALPNRWRNSGSSIRRRRAAASSSTDPIETISPVRSCRTISAIAPTLVLTAAMPQRPASISVAGIESPPRLGSTTTSLAQYPMTVFASSPRKCTLPGARSTASCSSCSR